MWTPRAFLVVLALLAVDGGVLDVNQQLERDEIIEAVNNAKTTWKAGRNFDSSLTKSYSKNLLGCLETPEDKRLPLLDELDIGSSSSSSSSSSSGELPDEFDSRKKWKKCISLHHIRDQGPCGSCWAVSTASSFTDRLCIASKMSFNEILSEENLLSCCCSCAGTCGKGCHGGYPEEAWKYFINTGIVTGGDYHTHQGCQPYQLPKCEHHVPGKRKNCTSYGDVPTPECQNKCYNKQYKKSYAKDFHKVKNAFTLSNDQDKIKTEIYNYGPVEAGFKVYEDFYSYKSGVYQHITGTFVGRHAVRVIGWGVEKGVDYWLVTNSWNTDWGDKGYFKIKRGTNECEFESRITGGYPLV